MGKLIHGMANHPLYGLWSGIKTRCYQPNDPRYKYYGGRGIKMHEQWINDPESFFKYVQSLPKFGKLGLSLDRRNNNLSDALNRLPKSSNHFDSK